MLSRMNILKRSTCKLERNQKQLDLNHYQQFLIATGSCVVAHVAPSGFSTSHSAGVLGQRFAGPVNAHSVACGAQRVKRACHETGGVGLIHGMGGYGRHGFPNSLITKIGSRRWI